jgi:hypothetical protein
MRRGLGLTALTLAVAVAHLQVVGKRPSCDLAAYEAIRLGMTLEEVSAAVGVQPGDYTEGHSHINIGDYVEGGRQEFLPPASRESSWDRDWVGARGRIYVGFDAEGRAWLKNYTPLRGGPGCALFNWLERLADWLID